MRNHIHEANLVSQRSARCPSLASGSRTARVDQCQQYQQLNGYDWATVYFKKRIQVSPRFLTNLNGQGVRNFRVVQLCFGGVLF